MLLLCPSVTGGGTMTHIKMNLYQQNVVLSYAAIRNSHYTQPGKIDQRVPQKSAMKNYCELNIHLRTIAYFIVKTPMVLTRVACQIRTANPLVANAAPVAHVTAPQICKRFSPGLAQQRHQFFPRIRRSSLASEDRRWDHYH